VVATSGTVGTYSFPQRKVLDHAFRRAGWTPESVGSEHIQIAQDLLFLQLSEYANAGFPLWTRVFGLLGIQVGSPEVTCPAGTIDVLHCYWRILNPYRGAATTTGSADASALFGGQANSDITIAGPNPGVTVNFTTATEVDTVGVLLGGGSPLTAALQVQTSTDGVTFATAQTLASATYTPQQWTYFDLDPSITSQYLRIISPGAGSWTLNQLNYGLANGQDIEIGPLNIDDYYNLPNKQFQSDRPNSGYVDRQIAEPIIKIWPTPDTGAFYNGTVSALTRRYIQDPGSMTNNIEVPIRWYEGVVARLGIRLMDELPDPDTSSQASYFSLMAKTQRRQLLEQTASKSEALMWSEERNRSPIRWAPNVRPYTR
jgi:hypothetical protein